MEPTVLHEDDEIIVVDKPSGMIVYPVERPGRHGAGPDWPTLSHWLEERYGEGGYHFVHRIDRETSGVLCMARTEAARDFLKDQFKNREVKKVYRAFVHGVTPEREIIERPIGSTRGGLGPRSAKKPYGTVRDATTIYRSIAHDAKTSYIEVFPKTGRTHQIRVHMAAVQHPIVGDVLYAPGRPLLLGFERLALHALSLSLLHPRDKTMTFTAPLPPDFVEAEAELHKSSLPPER